MTLPLFPCSDEPASKWRATSSGMSCVVTDERVPRPHVNAGERRVEKRTVRRQCEQARARVGTARLHLRQGQPARTLLAKPAVASPRDVEPLTVGGGGGGADSDADAAVLHLHRSASRRDARCGRPKLPFELRYAAAAVASELRHNLIAEGGGTWGAQPHAQSLLVLVAAIAGTRMPARWVGAAGQRVVLGVDRQLGRHTSTQASVSAPDRSGVEH
eukprot:scaffold17665_cov61-Phaeocystis_antarctica.AAC.3